MNKGVVRFLVVAMVSAALLACSGKKGGGSGSYSFPDTIIDDDLLVTVNNYPIRGYDLKVFLKIINPMRDEAQSTREYNKTSLEMLINRILIWQEAVALSTDVSDSTVHAFFSDFVRSMGGEAVFLPRLTEEGIDKDDLVQSIQRDLVIRKFVEIHFSPQVDVDETMAEEYYNLNPDRFLTPDSVKARHILLRVQLDDDEAIKKEKRDRIEEILAKLKTGSDFAELARQYSEGPSKDRGGDLGYFTRGTMVQPFDSVMFALRIGEVSGLVETQYGYHIIKVEDKKEGRMPQFEEIKDSLMFVMQRAKLALNIENHLKDLNDLATIKKNY